MTTGNKELIQEALERVVAAGDIDALAPYLSDDFVHHKPDSTSSTKEEWLAGARLAPIADMQIEPLQVMEDGDFVMLYSRRSLPNVRSGIAVIDIWRIDDGKIVEAWEIIEALADVAANLAWWKPQQAA
ncbi:nuclear transport factor 2 family protein [Glycomyces tenuis]|uniref:nuclear transport factor 2 family protein n=1 Tax=Glycomyces tenuis TaxID=58116 RepID=UPI000412C1F4|nr:nuclear transport factor 2 family protein [Glycomyces tenuis]